MAAPINENLTVTSTPTLFENGSVKKFLMFQNGGADRLWVRYGDGELDTTALQAWAATMVVGKWIYVDPGQCFIVPPSSDLWMTFPIALLSAWGSILVNYICNG